MSKISSTSPRFPNPFSATTTVPYRLAGDRPQRVELAIYDLRGAKVRSLVEASVPPGRHGAVWDGRDEAGRPVAAGASEAVRGQYELNPYPRWLSTAGKAPRSLAARINMRYKNVPIPRR